MYNELRLRCQQQQGDGSDEQQMIETITNKLEVVSARAGACAAGVVKLSHTMHKKRANCLHLVCVRVSSIGRRGGRLLQRKHNRSTKLLNKVNPCHIVKVDIPYQKSRQGGSKKKEKPFVLKNLLFLSL